MLAAITSLRVVKSPIQLKMQFIIAIRATNTSNIAPTLAANFSPSVVPLAIASSMLEPTFSIDTWESLENCSVCGHNILEITIAPGAAITEAANRCRAKSNRICGSSPPRYCIYEAITPPATVAIPPIITRRISERVILGK